MKILVIDDNQIVSNAIKRILQQKIPQVSVYSFEDPIRALEQFERIQPDVIIVDYYMSEMFGDAVIDVIRSTCQKAKIIGISGYHDHRLQRADIILDKPFSWDQLIAAIRES